jgi:nicotinamide riboside kinase
MRSRDPAKWGTRYSCREVEANDTDALYFHDGDTSSTRVWNAIFQQRPPQLIKAIQKDLVSLPH